MKKAFYFDVETTGLNPWKQDIIQLAFIIEIDGEVKEKKCLYIAPFAPENATDEALKINGYTLDEVKKFPPPLEAHKELCDTLGKYVNKFNKNDKFHPIGYNVKFDVGFLQSFFKKCEDKYYGSWFNWRLVDPIYRIHELAYEGKLDLPNHKLETVCKHFDIPIQAHDAISDINATRELRYVLAKG